MRAAVTGGAGFIGHHLVDGLLRSGHEVVVIDDFSTGDRERLALFGGDIAVTEGTVLDAGALDAAFAGCEVVFHQAAIGSLTRSLADPRADYRTSGRQMSPRNRGSPPMGPRKAPRLRKRIIALEATRARPSTRSGPQ